MSTAAGEKFSDCVRLHLPYYAWQNQVRCQGDFLDGLNYFSISLIYLPARSVRFIKIFTDNELFALNHKY